MEFVYLFEKFLFARAPNRRCWACGIRGDVDLVALCPDDTRGLPGNEYDI